MLPNQPLDRDFKFDDLVRQKILRRHMIDNTQHEPAKVENAESSVARRQLFTLGLFGLVGAIASSCSGGSFVGQAVRRTKSPGGGDGEGETIPGPESMPEVLDTECSATTTKAVNVAAFAEMSADRAPVAKFYGQSGNLVLSAIQIRDANTEKLLITTEAGRNLALHVLGEADRAPNGGIRPIVIDGLKLSAGENIRLITTINGKSEGTLVKVEFFTKFNGKDVIDLSNFSPEYNGNQFVPKFGDQSGFKPSDVIKYPGSTSIFDRPLVSAQIGAKWTLASNIVADQLVITDMVGTVLKEQAAIGFNSLDILEHQSFCVYRFADNGKVYRTMIRVG